MEAEMDFRIRQLEYFLVLAEKLNFRRAAFALDIAQPTLSFQIKSLESSFGVNLFDRSQREVRLTSEGERLRDHARAILSHARLAMDSVQNQTSASLTIACGPVGQYTLLPHLLREFKDRALDIALSVKSMPPEKMKQAAADGEVDLLLMTPNWQLAGMEYQALRSDRLSAVLPDRHPAVRRGWITLEEFSRSPVLIMAAKDCAKHRTFVSGLFTKQTLTPELVEVPFVDGIHFAMVAAGRGVALAAGSIAKANFPGIHFVPFDQPVHNMELGMMWHSGNESAALKPFLSMVKDIVRAQDEADLEETAASHRSVERHAIALA
jgi:DNA-binding transcriptional LysR family regulator